MIYRNIPASHKDTGGTKRVFNTPNIVRGLPPSPLKQSKISFVLFAGDSKSQKNYRNTGTLRRVILFLNSWRPSKQKTIHNTKTVAHSWKQIIEAFLVQTFQPWS